jgi:hypothetical protein
MRKDPYSDEAVPETLGEYRSLCAVLGGKECKAVKFLDDKISESPNGAQEVVIQADSQMRALLMPMIVG